MFTPSGRNQLLDATDIGFGSLHSGYPGTTQANEISGGSPAYARKALTFGSAGTPSAGIKVTNADATFDVPAGTTVRWIGYSTALTSGSGRAVSPNGADPAEFAVDVTANTIWTPGKTYVDGTKGVFYGGTAPAGLTAGTIYFTRDASGETFKVAATLGGSAIDITDEGSTDCIFSVIVEETFGAQGTMKLASGAAQLALNF